MTGQYRPEGLAQQLTYTMGELQRAMETGRILEARALLCDEHYNLEVELGCTRGIIPHEECAAGIAEGTVKNIAVITRVGRSVCFKVQSIEEGVVTLSRRAAQEALYKEVLGRLRAGDIIACAVTRLAAFGAFVDVGCGVISLISIDNISVSRIPHPGVRFHEGQQLRAVVKGYAPESKRLYLSHKELLGTWAENVAGFAMGQTVPGIVRSVEHYGVFVELAPNLAGLAEYQEGVAVGDVAIVYIKSILPDRMKIKLVIADHFKGDGEATPFRYFVQEDHLDRWRYSPEECGRVIETVFEGSGENTRS